MGAIQKIFTTGLGAALMTESSLRSAFSDIKVTGQAKDYMTRQIQKAKDEIVKVIIGELKRFFAHMDPQAEIQKALSGLKLEIQATITLVPPKPGHGSKRLRHEKSRVAIHTLKVKKS